MLSKNRHRMYTLRSNNLSFHVTGIICGWKDIGMGVRKGTVVSFVPTLFGYFWGIPSLCLLNVFFCDLYMHVYTASVIL